MRTFKRLLPVFLVTILLAGLATAQAAVSAGTSHSPGVVAPKLHVISGFDNPRFDFGTVVRDTADEPSARPGPWPAPRDVFPGNSFFTWSWLSLLIPR